MHLFFGACAKFYILLTVFQYEGRFKRMSFKSDQETTHIEFENKFIRLLCGNWSTMEIIKYMSVLFVILYDCFHI